MLRDVSERFDTDGIEDIEFDEAPGEPIRIVPSPDDPMAVARAFLADRYTRGGDLLLRHHRGSFHRWTGSCWPEDEERRVKAELYHWLQPAFYHGKTLEPFKPNAKRVSEVAHALAAIGHVPEATDRPCWLDGTEDDDVVAMANGLLHLSTRTVEAHRPAYFNEHGSSSSSIRARRRRAGGFASSSSCGETIRSRSTASPRSWAMS